MSQFHPTQHGGDNDFQLWQQQMMYKQLQELQRQQQLQQFDHGSRMQNSFGQFHGSAKPAPSDQLPAMLNEVPANESSSYAWSSNLVASDPRLASNSQVFINANTNWEQFGGSPATNNFANGSMYSNNQAQSMRSVGLPSQQVDQSFYPMPVSGTRGSGNQYSQFLGISGDGQNAITRIGADQFEKASILSGPFNSLQNEHGFREQGSSNPLQNFRGKGGLLSNAPLQNQGDSVKDGSPLINNLQHGFQVQDFHGRQNQVDFQGNLPEKPTIQAEPTSGAASLDPTEEKILFGSDEDSNWGALLRSGNSSVGPFDHGTSLDNDNFGPLPSLQSGSWSALMQEALQSTSSDNGIQEEWSGLSFQKTDQLFAGTATLPNEDGNKLAALNDSNIQSASHVSRPSLCNSNDGRINNPNFANFQHSTRTPYEQKEQVSHESSSTPVVNHQPTAEANNRYFRQNLKQKQSDEYGVQEQLHLSNGVWPQHKSDLPESNAHSSGMRAMQNTPGPWTSQQNMFNHNFSKESSSKPNDWSNNNPLGQGIGNNPNVFNSDGSFWKSGGGNANSIGRLEQLKPDNNTLRMPNDSSLGKNVGMMNSNMPRMNQEQYPMVTGRSDENAGINHNLGRRGPGTPESSGNNNERRSDDCNQEYLNVVSNEGQGHILNHAQHINSGFAARRHSFLAGKTAHPSTGSQNLSQPGQQMMGSYMLQNHLIGSSGMNVRPSSSPNPVSNAQFLPQSFQPPHNLEQRFAAHSQVAGNVASEKEIGAAQKMSSGEEELKSQQAIPSNDSSGSPYGGSNAVLSQNRTVQTSQNMLQLLHKVDNSTNSSTATASNVSNRGSFDVSTAHQQLNQPSFQGFGLRLAPPSQRQPTSGHLCPGHTSIDSKQADHTAGENDQMQMPSTSSSQSFPPSHPTSQPSQFHSAGIDNTELLSAGFSQLRSSGQQFPMLDSRPGSLPSMPQQVGSATLFKNVWTNISSQRLAGVQPNKITPSILQSMLFPNNSGNVNTWSSQQADDQGQKGETPSEVATSANSQNQEARQVMGNSAKLSSSEMANVDSMREDMSGGKEPLQKHPLDGSSAGTASSLSQLHQRGIANVSLTNSSGVDGIGLHGRAPTASNVQQQNYSLLNQMQAMRRADVDPSSMLGKRLKGADLGSDVSQMEWKAGQKFAYGANNSLRASTDNKVGTNVHSSFPADIKMLSFASRNHEEKGASIPPQLPGREVPSHDIVNARNHDLQNNAHSLSSNQSSNLTERSEKPRISPQMAPSWFEQYGSYRNGHTLAMYNAQKTPTPVYNLPKVSWNVDNNSIVEQRLDCGQSVRPGQYVTSTKIEVPRPPSNIKAASMVNRPKKRKIAACDLTSWHKIIIGPQKLRNMSMAEMDWAQVTNRLIEKVEDEAEILNEAPIIHLPRRRLILTTKLTQQLLPAIPAAILKAQAASAYESATFTVAKLTLRDACSMALLSANACAHVDNENIPSEETRNAEKVGDKYFSKVVEVFFGRFKQMEGDFLRLNKRTSMLDVQLECQELERFSIVNRLGKFHGRSHADGVEGSSTSETALRRIFPQRHVTSFSVSGNLPEGVSCLSL